MSQEPEFSGRRLSALRIADRKKWIEILASALEDFYGDLRNTASLLKISERTIHRWAREPDVVEEIKRREIEVKFLGKASASEAKSE